MDEFSLGAFGVKRLLRIMRTKERLTIILVKTPQNTYLDVYSGS